jgi:hypothetical protein
MNAETPTTAAAAKFLAEDSKTAEKPAESPASKVARRSIYEVFETSENMEREGIIVDYGEAGKFKIARAGGSNARFLKVSERLTAPYRSRIDRGDMEIDELQKLNREAFVDGILLGWENVVGKDGKDLAYNRDAALKLFTDLPDLCMDLQEQAQRAANFRLRELEKDSKN